MAVTYNPLAQARSGYVDVPISWSEVVVTDAAGNTVDAQVLPFHYETVLPALAARDNVVDGRRGSRGGGDVDQHRSDQHPYTLMLPVESAEPLEATVFNISRKKGEAAEARDANTGDREEGQGDEPRRRRHYVGGKKGGAAAAAAANTFSISSDIVTLTFDGSTGRLARMETHAEGGGSDEKGGTAAAALDVDQGWFYYPTFAGGETTIKAAEESNNDAAADGGHPTGGQEEEEEKRQHRRHHQPNVLTGKEAAMEASRLHGQLGERLHVSQDQKGGAYIFRPEGEGRGGAIPVGAAAGRGRGGRGEGGQDELVIREWWVEEGPIVSEVYQVSTPRSGSTYCRLGGLLWTKDEDMEAAVVRNQYCV